MHKHMLWAVLALALAGCDNENTRSSFSFGRTPHGTTGFSYERVTVAKEYAHRLHRYTQPPRMANGMTAELGHLQAVDLTIPDPVTVLLEEGGIVFSRPPLTLKTETKLRRR